MCVSQIDPVGFTQSLQSCVYAIGWHPCFIKLDTYPNSTWVARKHHLIFFRNTRVSCLHCLLCYFSNFRRCEMLDSTVPSLAWKIVRGGLVSYFSLALLSIMFEMVLAGHTSGWSLSTSKRSYCPFWRFFLMSWCDHNCVEFFRADLFLHLKYCSHSYQRRWLPA